ncbi:MAG TPA: hypothetical protein VHY20_10715, partial [Pirellulales bacterium]|nr:hypothetical protein [Pirellulales bacterium]
MASTIATQGSAAWRTSRAPNWRRRLRSVRRLLVTVLAVVLVGLFVRAVFEPWLHPAVRLVAITGADYDGFQVAPLAFAAEDREALAPLAKAYHGQSDDWQVPALATPQAMARLGKHLDQAAGDGPGVLIVYIAAHGVCLGDSGYLLCGNFDASRPADGRISVRELISMLSRAPGHTKLLILDTGRLTLDPRMGVLVNDFPDLLKREVAAAGHPNLWVL